ncbi:type II secretion system protein, partial [Parachitinimonas caeni]
MRRPDSQTGFTLPEVATVLVIIGLILPLIFAAARTQLLQSQVSKSKANIEQVKLALQRYVASTGRMPCPAAVNLPQTSPN